MGLEQPGRGHYRGQLWGGQELLELLELLLLLLQEVSLLLREAEVGDKAQTLGRGREACLPPPRQVPRPPQTQVEKGREVRFWRTIERQSELRGCRGRDTVRRKSFPRREIKTGGARKKPATLSLGELPARGHSRLTSRGSLGPRGD